MEQPVNLASTSAPVVEGVILWAGKSLRNRIDIAPGDVLEVRLRPALPDALETPDDVVLALRQSFLTEAGDTLTAGTRRRLLYHTATAKRPGNRAKRNAALKLAIGS